MKIAIRSLSDDKLSVTLSNYQVNSDSLNRAVSKIAQSCHVNMQKALNRLIIVLERKNKTSDLHITAGRLLAEIGPMPA